MLVTAAAKLPINPEWSFELKWDGFRCIATTVDGLLELRSKNGTDMTAWFPELTRLAEHIGQDVVLDAEVVVLDERGHPDFDALRRLSATLVVFDILRLGEHDLIDLTLSERRVILRAVVHDALPLVQISSFGTAQAFLPRPSALDSRVSLRNVTIRRIFRANGRVRG